ncbi:MAG: ribonuclease R [Burkholderiaceae bacterium]
MKNEDRTETSPAWVPPTREEILECLRQADGPLTPAQLGEQLSVPSAHFDALNRRLLAMERDGQLLPNRKGVLLLASKLDLLAGRVQGHRDGFGFLLPDAGGPDVFLPPREMQKAMHGDRVLVKRVGFDGRGRPEGVIVEVTERANRRLVGRFLSERGVTIVVPEDKRIKHDILIPPGESRLAQPGQVVTVEILDPPSGHAAPIGRVLEVLGEIDDPGMEIEIAVRKFDVPHQFGDEARRLASKLPSAVRAADLKGRVDLRDVPLVTIDGEDARDFDDAVYCEPIGDKRRGGHRLIVAIADVGHYVRPSDAIDRDAALRSTSVYFPRRVIPMLPEKLSNGLCSLNPAVDRLVLVCDMIVTAKGQLKAYQFFEAVMHSAARLTYDEVWGVLSGRDAQAIRQRAALVPHLQDLHDLYRVLAKAREARGAMDFDTVETKIVCNAAGRIERIEPRTRNDAHRLIEECMLAANVCAADFMRRSRHPGLYRIHEGPTPERLKLLREFLRSVGLALGGGDDPAPSDYAELAAQVRERPDAPLLQTMMLRSMQQAVYSPHNCGHFGLAYEAYAHFTSPIRRYPDLLTHRVIKALLRGERYAPEPARADDGGEERLPGAEAAGPVRRRARPAVPVAAPKPRAAAGVDAWEQHGLVCSANERRADEASRDVEAWLKCQYMRERVGEEFAGRITGVAPFGVFVTLDALYVEGLVHVSELGTEYFQYNEASHELRGERTGRRFRLTDELHVLVSRVDLEARRIEFRPVQRLGWRDPGAAGAPRASAVGGASAAGSAGAGAKKKAAPPKTERAQQARAARAEARRKAPPPSARHGAGKKKSKRKRR